MRIPLAWANLTHRKTRSAVAVAGVAFALILIFTQLGFRGSAQATATLIYDALDFDLLLTSSEYIDLHHPGSFPRTRLAQAQAVDGVDRVVPLYIGYHLWRNPDDGGRRSIMMLGFRPSDDAFTPAEIQAAREALQEPDTLLMDRSSRPEFGPQAGPDGGPLETELGPRHVTVIGHFEIGRSFGADGLVIGSDQTYARVLRGRSLDQVGVGLVKLRKGVSPDQAAAALTAVLPDDVRVRTRADLYSREQSHWVDETPIGIIFTLGVVVSLAVGVVFVYQVMSSDIASRLHEFATLKALGHGPGYLTWVVLGQALLLAVFAYVPSLLVALGMYALTHAVAGIPIFMDLTRALLVAGLAAVMCSASGLLAVRKVHAVDPADLF